MNLQTPTFKPKPTLCEHCQQCYPMTTSTPTAPRSRQRALGEPSSPKLGKQSKLRPSAKRKNEFELERVRTGTSSNWNEFELERVRNKTSSNWNEFELERNEFEIKRVRTRRVRTRTVEIKRVRNKEFELEEFELERVRKTSSNINEFENRNEFEI
ncbi:hypothetical protein B9Z55_029059 [Caenorhabditis nigoni]|uniref:Uncharacterized protein n=1 Tax=Caenorhabditis nigoni TaxID=1611254 RepID=A0A2G5S977_9PELO|nr:hypothetical protein B9Z55_029059 [Caenorhabditis nigoni]